MELFKITQPTDLNNQGIEQITPQKQEYKLLETYIRRSGLGLFCYNQFEDTITLVIEQIPTKIRVIIVPISAIEDKLDYEEYEHKRCEVDSRLYYFESLNLDNAIKRVTKWKLCLIPILCNMKVYNPNSKISFY